MSLKVLLVLLLPAACAGPSAHQARPAPEPETVRLGVASTLGPEDPLAAPNCGLPTSPNSPCAEVAPEPEKKKEEGHQHHHGGSATTEPAVPAPQNLTAAPPAMTIDPVCKMKIDPKVAKGGTLKVNGTEHWFCSSSCRRTFLSQNPGAK